MVFRPLRGVKRQDVLLILQKHDALLANLTAHIVVRFRTLVTNHLLRIHRRAEDGAQHTACLLIQHAHWHLSVFQQLFERIAQIVHFIAKLALLRLAICVGAHLDVQATRGSFQTIRCTSPVADERAIPIPFLLQDTVQQLVVVTAVHTLPFVVRAHDGIDMCLLHRLLERAQINLAHRTVRHIHVDAKTIRLLVVQHEMLQTAGNAVCLCSLDVWHHHLTSQERVFTHILKRTSVQWGALDVHTRT